MKGLKMTEEAKQTQANQLNSYLERIERLNLKKADLLADIRDVFAEAKGNGFDPKVMRDILKLRKQNAADRAESEYLRNEYKSMVGIEG